MSNIQHSSRSDEWYTPKHIVDLVQNVMPIIDLDPASSEAANKSIKATRIITTNSLDVPWATTPVSVYLNPPGGKIGNRSKTALYWQKLIDLKNSGLLTEAIFMGFSLEHLAVTQACSESMCDFPIVVPRRRICFVSPDGNYSQPTHSNVIVYVPGLANNTSVFKDVFSSLGACLHPG